MSGSRRSQRQCRDCSPSLIRRPSAGGRCRAGRHKCTRKRVSCHPGGTSQGTSEVLPEHVRTCAWFGSRTARQRAHCGSALANSAHGPGREPLARADGPGRRRVSGAGPNGRAWSSRELANVRMVRVAKRRIVRVAKRSPTCAWSGSRTARHRRIVRVANRRATCAWSGSRTARQRAHRAGREPLANVRMVRVANRSPTCASCGSRTAHRAGREVPPGVPGTGPECRRKCRPDNRTRPISY